MKSLRRFIVRLTGFIARRRDEARLREEVEEHLTQQTAENVRAGMPPAEARRQAVLKFGAVETIKEEYRDQRSVLFFDHLSQDIRYAIRGLRRSPGFAVIATLTLALGIGANTAMFAVVNAVLLKPLPFVEADRLMLVHLLAPDQERGGGILRENAWSYPKYRAFLDTQHVFDETALFAGREFSVTGDGDPERVRGEVVTDRYPALLGIYPSVGRSFTGDEAHRPGAERVALIGHGLWMRRYAGDPSIVGRTVRIGATRRTVR